MDADAHADEQLVGVPPRGLNVGARTVALGSIEIEIVIVAHPLSVANATVADEVGICGAVSNGDGVSVVLGDGSAET
jgi:hypothetical protein